MIFGNNDTNCNEFYINVYVCLSAWFCAILPKSALTVDEEAWNAYPYTKTRYRCPFVDKFSLEIETRYVDDCCEQDNVFRLKEIDLGRRKVGTKKHLSLQQSVF